MARTNFFLLATVLLSFLLFRSPAVSQITSDGTLPGQPIGHDWEVTFLKLAGSSDDSMADPSVVYDPHAGTYSITSAGYDIWDSQDGIAFAYMTIPTDVDWGSRFFDY